MATRTWMKKVNSDESGNSVFKWCWKRKTHRTLILRVEMTDGLKAAFSSPAALFREAFFADSIVCLRLSSAALLVAGAGLNNDTRVAFWKIKNFHCTVCTGITFVRTLCSWRLDLTDDGTYRFSSPLHLLLFSFVCEILIGKNNSRQVRLRMTLLLNNCSQMFLFQDKSTFSSLTELLYVSICLVFRWT